MERARAGQHQHQQSICLSTSGRSNNNTKATPAKMKSRRAVASNMNDETQLPATIMRHNRRRRSCSTTLADMGQLLIIVTAVISILLPQVTHTTSTTASELQADHLNDQNQKSTHLQLQQQAPQQQPRGLAPVVAPFAFGPNVQVNQRSTVVCSVVDGDLPADITWLKDGLPLTPRLVEIKRITIKSDADSSTLKFNPVRLEHTGNYTCVARNRAGSGSHLAQLLVHSEPRWLREPKHEPIVATRGQIVVIDCQTTGWPKPTQSWQIKTESQSDYAPLAATGRISLAANGSLVIHNADKSDEANYLCRSFNGIGKGIHSSTSLKVNVPAHFESTKQQTSVVRRQNKVQLRCDAYGDEPITVEWYKNKQRVSQDLDKRYTILDSKQPNMLLSLLVIQQTQRQDNSVYECVTRNLVGKDRLPIELIVQEEPDNIQELQATQINSRSVTLIWSEPYDGRSPITNYNFQYKKVQETGSAFTELGDFLDASGMAIGGGQQQLLLDGASVGAGGLKPAPVSTTADDWQQASRILLPVQANPAAGNGTTTRSITIDKLDPSTKYVLRALAMNAIGHSKFSQPMEFVTEEEAPEVGPTNIRAQAINSTSIQVSWDEIPKSKQLGRIHGYYIGYRVAAQQSQQTAGNSSSALSGLNAVQPSFVYKPYVINDLVMQQQQPELILNTQSVVQRLETNLQDLRRDTAYEITVVAFNSRGSGPSSDFILCKTIEMEAPKPVKIQIRRELNESIFIEWQRDPTDQNPVDYYDLYQEKNSASQEWVHLRLPGNQSQYKAPGLKCGTRYQFYIVAHNKVGKSLPSEVVSASTSGKLPVIPTKTSLIKMVNSTCLSVNLNSFQDNGCRIRTFTVRYRVEKNSAPNGSATSTLMGTNGLSATHQALTSSSSSSINSQLPSGSKISGSASSSSSATPSDWITIRPKSNSKRGNEEDRIEYLCNLSPTGEYTVHVAASNDVGRSDVDYTVLMTSDELRHSYLRDFIEFLSGLPNVLAYIPSLLVFLLAALFLALVGLILYTSTIKYYQKFVIMRNQIRATRRAKHDEKRRRKLNNQRHQQKLDLWADEYEDEENVDGDDEDDEDDSSASSNAIHPQFGPPQNGAAGHYISNIANSAFDTSSIDSPCNKFSGGSCVSTASTDSIHGGRFQCLNSKQYVKMNEYTMLPSISASLSPPNDIYGHLGGVNSQQHQHQQQQQASANNSLYYSTLRRSNMQTYVPRQRQQQQQQQPQQGSPSQTTTLQMSPSQHQQQPQASIQRRRSQNVADIYGYYLAPQTNAANTSQQAVDEAVNSIFVPPQQIIYSAPNIRRQPVFL